MTFVHLHVHSEYSLLDGGNRIPDLVRRAAQLEMPALALTDHGCLFGAIHFYEAARRAGIKPILGMEAYVAPGDRRERTRAGEGENAYYHLLVIARDRTGYRNLVKLSSLGYTEGFYHRPRVDRETLARHSDGLIVASACLAGEVARHLQAGDRAGARDVASWYANVFDGRYYLEVQAHDAPGQPHVNDEIFKLGEELGLPIIATNDVHFLRPEDHPAHDVLLCIGLGKDRGDPQRMRYDAGLYFKSVEEIASRFPDHPEVIENTVRIAEGVDVELRTTYHLPAFPLPPGYSDPDSLLIAFARQGAKARYGPELPREVEERLEYELGVITRTGYSGFYLIVQDFINWAKAQGVPVGPGRGSAAGSLVAYVLGITDIDPLVFDLLFERFLNPERVSMPDMDIDFCFERRGEVIEYVRQKYGRESVGQIITFGTLKSRAVVKDVGRVLGFKPAETDEITKLIPNQPGMSFSVAEAVKRIPEVRQLYESDERYRQLFDFSMTLEGLSRHASVHAAGVVIAPGPLDEYVPVCTQQTKGAGGNGESAVVVTQYDMSCLEHAGMLKIDFLGLKTLTVIHDAVEMIRQRHGALRHPITGVTYERIEEIPLDDPDIYEMLARGGTAGAFQFESALATDKLKAMRCDRFDDLVATNALIRPGPLDSGMADVYVRRKLGQEPVAYPHPALERVLADTYGVIVYQEQVTRIANVLAGFTLGEADVLRKAVGKKDAELIHRELEHFVERAIEKGVEPRTALEISAQIETFGRYGFNKSHSAAYALLSYRTAWLKCHYPAEYMAALLSSVIDKTEDVVRYIQVCRELPRHVARIREPIEVLHPDVNVSGWKFTVAGSGNQIRFGLGAIRGVGEAAVASILKARAAGGPFRSLFDFLTRVDLRLNNKRAVEVMIAAGAFDEFGHRAQLVAALDAAYHEAQLRHQERETGQVSLFGESAAGGKRVEPPIPDVPAWTEADRLAREKEALGFFISGHPLERYREIVRIFEPVTTTNLRSFGGQKVELACVVTQVSRQLSRRDRTEYARITVEDFHGSATVLAFKDVWARSRDLLQQDAVVLIRGDVSSRERDELDPPIFLEAATALDALAASGELGVLIEVAAAASLAPDAFAQARTLVTQFPGPAPLYLQAPPDNGLPPARLQSRTLRVSPTAPALAGLREIFGEEHVRLIRATPLAPPKRVSGLAG